MNQFGSLTLGIIVAGALTGCGRSNDVVIPENPVAQPESGIAPTTSEMGSPTSPGPVTAPPEED